MIGIKPQYVITRSPPTSKMANIVSLGDKLFFYRAMISYLQSMGNYTGYLASINAYDFEILSKWFYFMDTLDKKSHSMANLAYFYFGQSKYKENLVIVGDYLYDYAKANMEDRWWWMLQAAYMNEVKINDYEKSLKFAYELQNADPSIDMPIFARRLPAFFLEVAGDYVGAKIAMEAAAASEDLTPQEQKYMKSFIENRLVDLQEKVKSGEFERSHYNAMTEWKNPKTNEANK